MGSVTPIRLEELLEHSAWLTALARRLVADSGAAEDLVQETWLTALERPPGDRRNLRGWLSAVLRNAARGRARRARVDPVAPGASGSAGEPLDELGTPEPETPEGLAASLETQRALAGSVLELEEPYRATVILRYWHGLDAGAIARREGLAAGTVRWRLKQGLDRLRSRLDDAHGGERRAWCLALLPVARRPLPVSTASVPASGSVPLLVALGKGLFGMHPFTQLALAAALTALTWFAVERGRSGTGLEPATAPAAARAAVSPVAEPAPPVPGLAGERAPAVARAAGPPRPEDTSSGGEAGPDGDWLEQRVELRVVDRAGRPISTARVHTGGVLAEELAPDGRLTLTLKVHRRAPQLDFQLRAPGFASERLEFRPEPSEALHLGEVVLGPGGDVLGRVLDRAGEPLAGAWVEVDTARFSKSDVDGERLVRHRSDFRGVETGADGGFHLTGIPAGTLRVWAGRAGLMASATNELELAGVGVLEGLELVLEPYPAERVIAGRVVDGEGHGVRSSVRFESRSFYGSSSRQSVTDEDGRFALLCKSSRRSGSLTVTPFTDELGPVKLDGLRAGASGLSIELPRARALSIEVRGPDGRLPQPELELFAGDGDRLAGVGSRLGDRGLEDGVFSLRVPPEPFTVIASAPGHERRTFGPFSPDALPERIVCELARQAGVRGRVFDLEGLPLEGAEIRVVAEARQHVVIDDFPVRVALTPEVDTTSDGSGHFEATVREPGNYYVQVSAAGHALAELGPHAIDPERGLDLEPLRLTRGGALEGRVTGEGELAGRVVAVSRGDGRARSTRTGPGGYFRFEHLTPGPWQAELRERDISVAGSSGSSDGFRRPGPIPFDRVVRQGETTRVVLGRGEVAHTLRGRLTLDGIPARGFRVSWKRALGGLIRAEGPTLDEEGRFELGFQHGGPIELLVAGPGSFVVLVTFDLSEPRTEWSCALELATLDVYGLAPESEVPEALYLWQRDGVTVAAPLEGDAAGTSRGLRVPAGAGRVVSVGIGDLARPDRSALLARTPLASFEAPAGETTRVELP